MHSMSSCMHTIQFLQTINKLNTNACIEMQAIKNCVVQFTEDVKYILDWAVLYGAHAGSRTLTQLVPLLAKVIHSNCKRATSVKLKCPALPTTHSYMQWKALGECYAAKHLRLARCSRS